jgi:hypothetical protein
MVSIRHIALPDAHNHPLVAVIIHVEHHMPWCGRAPDDTQTGGIPDKVVHPPLAALNEEGGNCLHFWIATFDAIAAALIAVATG